MKKRVCIGMATVLLILVGLSFWPGYLVHDYFWSKSDSSYGSYSLPYAEGVSTTQYFIPQLNWLSSIDIVANFDKTAVGDEKLQFVLYDEDGNKIYSKEIAVSKMQDGLYYTIPIRKKLKAGEQYHWTLSAAEDLPYDWRLMLSTNKIGIASENTFVQLGGLQDIGEEQETVSQYCYYVHKDKVIIIATCWGGSILVYIIILEAIQKLFAQRTISTKKEEKQNDL